MRHFLITALALMTWMMMVPPAMAEEAVLHAPLAAKPVVLNVPSVETVQPVTQDFFISLPWFGQVIAMQFVTLTARVAGSIASLGVEDGARVRSGDIVFELGGREIELRRIDMQTQLQSAQLNLELAKKNRDIRRALLIEHLSSKELVNTAEQAVFQAIAQLSTAKQALAVFDANVHIRAPIGGSLTARTVNVGQYVPVGTVLASIVNPDHVRVQASLFPPSGMSLKGLQTMVRGASDEKERYGKVQRVFPDADAAGAVQVWIEGDELAGLRPGDSVSGELMGVSHRSLAVPASAIARDEQGEAFVFIQTPQGFRKQALQTGLVDHDWVEIISGLDEKERVVSKGAYELLYGDFSKIYREPD